MELKYEYDPHGDIHFPGGSSHTRWVKAVDVKNFKDYVNGRIENYISKFSNKIILELERDSKIPRVFILSGSITKEEFGIGEMCHYSFFTVQVNLVKMTEEIDKKTGAKKIIATLAYHSYPDKIQKNNFEVNC